MLTESSQSYFGFSFGGLWFVCTTLLFGWKISPYVYHTIGLAATGFLRAQGIPCSLYIDDRLNGELLRPTGFWSILLAATGAIFVVLSVLVDLGYTIGIKKSVLVPVTSLGYLGLIVDSVRQSFLVPRRKIESWALIREKILYHSLSLHLRPWAVFCASKRFPTHPPPVGLIRVTITPLPGLGFPGQSDSPYLITIL